MGERRGGCLRERRPARPSHAAHAAAGVHLRQKVARKWSKSDETAVKKQPSKYGRLEYENGQKAEYSSDGRVGIK